MTLSPGTRFGPYTIVAAIGVGGMGEVYRATDSSLKRDVAIKVLPQYFAADADRVARFRREAEMLAGLNHQNIAHVYGLEHRNDTTALVMELVDGPTLQDRIAAGPIPLAEALPIALQIADALEAAHERGIVHRDLKPANIKLTTDGTVKVLDFGIAKVLNPPSSQQTLVASTPSFTEIGTILGTAAYMSPEQARGKPVDKRTDIWAFGCVLYEMLAGRPAFNGEDATETVARVLEHEVDMSALPPAVPASVRHVLVACLRKDSKRRMRDIGDVKLALDGTFGTSVDAGARRTAGRPAWRRMAPLAAAMLLIVVAVSLAAWRLWPQPAPLTVTRVSEQISIMTGLPLLSISRDGTRVAWNAASGVHVRRLDEFAARNVLATSDRVVARPPCFSPDGTWIAYMMDGRMSKAPLAGGAPLVLADGLAPSQCTWGDDGYVYFSTNDGIGRVADVGGNPETVVKLDSERESAYFAPQLLPDRKHLLFGASTVGGADDFRIIAVNLETGERDTLRDSARIVGYVLARNDRTRAQLIFGKDDILFAAPLDLGRLEVGEGHPVVADVTGLRSLASAVVSPSGTLAYLAGVDEQPADSSLVWIDRAGAEQALPEPPHMYGEVTLAPDGQRAAVVIVDPRQLSAIDLWIYDFGGDRVTRLTSGGNNVAAIWTPAGDRLIYQHSEVLNVGTGSELRVVPADNSAPSKVLVPSTAEWIRGRVQPTSISPDGRELLATNNHLGVADIWVIPLPETSSGPGDAPARAFLATSYDERDAVFSPDSRFVAYVSNESGPYEVYVAPFPGPGGKSQVSRGGGTLPRWSAGGRELVYLNGNEMMAADVETSGAFRAHAPHVLFAVPPLVGNRGSPYSVMADGTRCLVAKSNLLGTERPAELRVVVNGLAEPEPLAAH
ncbi:MAG TPA: protein kinase [Gammaproteobacteria bacterium]|nr:protein kinase [Gammaproteobacteria bacterium]